MSTFRTAYDAWRDLPFPPGNPNDAIDEFHADLVLADTWVAESVIPYVTRGCYDAAKIDVIAGLDQLRIRADDLLPAADTAEAELLDKYREYIQALRTIYALFLAERRCGSSAKTASC